MAKLYFRYGAMNSGKTTALMQVAYNYKERGMRVLILKPAIDTKGQDSIISRLGISCKVDQLVTPEMDVVELVRANGGRPWQNCLCALRREPVLHARAGRPAVSGHGGPGYSRYLLRSAG